MFVGFVRVRSGLMLPRLKKGRLNAEIVVRGHFVRRKGLCDSMALEYITNRELGNSSGQNTGKIRILKLKEEMGANVELTCPECGTSEKRKEVWGEPFVIGSGASKKFTLACNKCGFKINLLKLKKEVKKK